MKNTFLPIVAAPFILCAAATAQDTHVSIANEVLNMLSDTEICLNLCRDEASIKEVIPQLQELALYAAEIKERQNKLADLTPEDDREVAKLIPQFLTLQKAIDAHINRLIADNLLTPELAEVLHISPDYIPDSAPTTN